jgi:Flp pilus assembly protein TadB
MALSDDEQRILRQIEQELQNDSKFAQAVSPSGLYTHSVRTVRWAVVGLVVCLGLLIALLQIHFLAAFAVFVVMLGLVVVIERNARAMGKAGIQDMAGAIRKARSAAGRRFP